MSEPRCSIVIRCYNEERHIGQLLDGIMQQSVQGIEIIIMDSGSTDATLSIAARFPVRVLSIRPEVFSFGRSLNIGCQSARSEIIVIASAHVYPVCKDWLERVVTPFIDAQVALVYGKQRGNGLTKYSENQLFSKWYPNESNPDQNHPFCNNANAAIRRSLWEQMPYDETLTGLEDIDWARRAMQMGHKIVYAAEAEVVHVHNELPKQIYNRYRREAIAMKCIFPQERFNFWDLVRLFAANVISDFYHSWHDEGLWRNMMSIFVFRLMQFWGTYQGFSQPGPVTGQLRRTFYYPKSLERCGSVELKPDLKRATVDYTTKPEER